MREFDRDNRGYECRERRLGREKINRRIRISSLDVLLGVIAVLLVVNLVCMVLEVRIEDIPTSVTVVWCSAVSFVVTVLASWGM